MIRRSHSKRVRGYSLIELVIVIVVLGGLAMTASSRYLNLQKEARIAVVETIMASMRAINEQVHLMSNLNYVIARNGQSSDSRLRFLDLNRDGIQQVDQGEWDLVWNHVDNTHMPNAIVIDDSFVQQLVGHSSLYIGYDRDGSGLVLPGDCWAHYQQPRNEGDIPIYSTEISGC